MTIPKAIAQRYGIEPGDEIEWLEAGDAIRVLPPAAPERATDVERRLELFDRATERQRRRQGGRRAASAERGWEREDLYVRESAR